jgi:hypothetical protein
MPFKGRTELSTSDKVMVHKKTKQQGREQIHSWKQL